MNKKAYLKPLLLGGFGGGDVTDPGDIILPGSDLDPVDPANSKGLLNSVPQEKLVVSAPSEDTLEVEFVPDPAALEVPGA